MLSKAFPDGPLRLGLAWIFLPQSPGNQMTSLDFGFSSFRRQQQKFHPSSTAATTSLLCSNTGTKKLDRPVPRPFSDHSSRSLKSIRRLATDSFLERIVTDKRKEGEYLSRHNTCTYPLRNDNSSAVPQHEDLFYTIAGSDIAFSMGDSLYIVAAPAKQRRPRQSPMQNRHCSPRR